MRRLVLSVGLIVTLSSSVSAAERRWEVYGHTHTIAVWNELSGPGAQVPGLAVSYDMSVFDLLLGGRHTIINGSGVTANAAYPITEGEAATNNLYAGLRYRPGPDEEWAAGFQAYAMAGDRTVGRVFGDELPWGDFDRENGLVQTPHFDLDLYDLSWKRHLGDLIVEIDGGSLAPARLPRLSRTVSNGVKLGSFFYRAPITNSTIWEKDEHRIEQGRHVLRGVDVYLEQALEGGWVRSETAWVTSDPTPVTDLERDSALTRLAIEKGKFGAGATLVQSRGGRTGGVLEEQLGMEADLSVQAFPELKFYGAVAGTDADRPDRRESHRDDAWIGGVQWKPGSAEASVQYQALGENYDLIGSHKSEEYPSNYHGVVARASRRLPGDLVVRAVAAWLRQERTRNAPGDTLFGDPYYAATDSRRGKVHLQKLELEGSPVGSLKARAYVEHVSFRKSADLPTLDVDKDIWNAYTQVGLPIGAKARVEGSYRHFFSTGEWDLAVFDSYQDTLEAAFEYRFTKDRFLLVIFQRTLFRDDNRFAAGLNDYDADQLIAQLKVVF